VKWNTPNYAIEDMSTVTRQAGGDGVKRFQDAAFGLSVHWGLYALEGSGEWVYYLRRPPLDAYRKLMTRFNPVRFNADEWGDLMLEAGQKFLVITTKHHDGFCLWDTALTDFKVTNTAFKRDVIRELAEALSARGLGLHFYYSLVDWTHPAYRTDWGRYVEYYQRQIGELCTNYGPIGGVIFDGYWPRYTFEGDEVEWFSPRAAWDLAGTYDLIHRLQPQAMIANNTHVLPLKGEDYQVWELDLPGENKIGFNCTEIGDKPTACWWNINEGWSYQPDNHRVKSAEALVQTFQRVRSRRGVFFLNAGPRRFGDIHPEEQQVLRTMGQMIRAHGSGTAQG